MLTGVAFDFQLYLHQKKTQIEAELASLLGQNDPEILWEAMRYSVLSGGKRIRGVLCLAGAEAASSLSGSTKAEGSALRCACAIEMVHAMSLIHDDLPCMDNDDLRRGRPTNHKVFGEAMALLAGDALLVMASEILLRTSDLDEAPDLACLIDVARELARTSGAYGLVGGQVADMTTTGEVQADPVAADKLRIIHERKTGALITFSVWSGARLGGASSELLSSLKRFGQTLGLSFQIADDLLDVTGSAETLGKTPGKDEKSGKLTWVSVYGVAGARSKLAELEEEGRAIIAGAGLSNETSAPLLALLDYSINRQN